MQFSDHFKHSMRAIGAGLAVLLGLFLWLRHRIHDTFSPRLPTPAHAGLMPDDREAVSFNEKTHRLTVATPSGTMRVYARNPAVHLKADGRVVVDRHLLGFEARPMIGVGYSDTTRAIIGVEPFYFGAFDASVALGVSLDKAYVFAKPYAALGYNCWGNLSVNAGVNPVGLRQIDVILFLSVKI